MDNMKKKLAGKLLDIKAIKLQPNDPFTWASGWKSPIYCDNRKVNSYPEVRSFVKLELAHTILENFPEAEAVAGVATGVSLTGRFSCRHTQPSFCLRASETERPRHGQPN